MNLQKIRNVAGNYIFILPALFFFALFGAYPFVKVIQLSVTNWDGISSQMTYIGWDNFKISCAYFFKIRKSPIKFRDFLNLQLSVYTVPPSGLEPLFGP